MGSRLKAVEVARSSARNCRHRPPLPRNVGTPLAADTPAPVRMVTRDEPRRRAASSSSLWSSLVRDVRSTPNDQFPTSKHFQSPIPDSQSIGNYWPLAVGRREWLVVGSWSLGVERERRKLPSIVWTWLKRFAYDRGS